jgi:hypothetical protein
MSARARADDPLATELAAAGGARAPSTSTARLRALVAEALAHGDAELRRARSGYERPVTVAIASDPDASLLLAATPVRASLRADPEDAGERSWLVVAATVGALVALAEPPPPRSGAELALRAGRAPGDFLLLGYPAPAAALDADALDDLVPLAFEEHVGTVDRLRARALALPAAVLGEAAPTLKDPIGAGHPLRVAEAVARLGGSPADPRAAEALDDAVEALLGLGGAEVRPHEDPDPARRVARRILQRLNGMGKWGGYHTDFAHLARGFAGNERALAQEVGEALLAAGLLAEKPSVGQRHVFLNPRRAADIHRLIETGDAPSDLRLP